jgi:uncharacterized protein
LIKDRTTIIIRGEEFDLCPEKCLYHLSSNTLFIADLHFGKTTHFRKAGIPIPGKVAFDEFERFNNLIQRYQPDKIVFLGDLFHSNQNSSVNHLKQIIDNEVQREFYLVLGNHDIMRKDIYLSMSLIVTDSYRIGEILFTHEPVEDENRLEYNVYGHIHPGIVLKGRGKQTLRLPCFYFNEASGILPAYGLFTGLFTLTEYADNDQIYVIAEDKIIKVQ